MLDAAPGVLPDLALGVQPRQLVPLYPHDVPPHPLGMDSAAASGTTPRAPAHDTTAGTRHSPRPDRPDPPAPRHFRTSATGNTHAIRTTSRVAVIASALSNHGSSAAARRRISAGSCSPVSPNTTLSSRNTTVA